MTEDAFSESGVVHVFGSVQTESTRGWLTLAQAPPIDRLQTKATAQETFLPGVSGEVVRGPT